MKILYGSFNEWEKSNLKNRFYPLAISYTIPKYYKGEKFLKLTPSKKLFFDTHKNGYEPRKFFSSYYSEIKKYTKNEIFSDLTKYSNDICLLGWEGYGVFGECQFCISWLYNVSFSDALAFEIIKNDYPENHDFYSL